MLVFNCVNGTAPDYVRNDFKYTPFPLTTRSGRGTFNPIQTVGEGGSDSARTDFGRFKPF